ncbi:RNA polymerase sigma factor [Flavobacteriales bacterium]|nr:RNA polymerase sigma factor [Flavobacteriales bacterium]
MTQDQIIQQIQSGNREKAFKELYNYFPKVEALILKSGGSKNNASDIFQEALILLFRKLQKCEFVLTSSLETYLYSVCRFMCYDQNRANAKQTDWNVNLEESEQDEIASIFQEEEKYKLAETALQTLGEKCLEILNMFYHQGVKMAEIAKKMKLSSAKIAKNQKYKCLEKAKQKFVELRATK